MRQKIMFQGPLRLVWLPVVALACSSPPPPPAPRAVVEIKAKPVDMRPDQAQELRAAEFRQILEAAKVDARRTCENLDRGGERIDVELTIAGSSGVVKHTSVWHDGGNPALARCVARELARAVFKPTRQVTTRQAVTVLF